MLNSRPKEFHWHNVKYKNLLQKEKKKRLEWEEYDSLTEGTILDITNEISGILQRKLQCEELIRYLEMQINQ